jgi:hypothetical protein
MAEKERFQNPVIGDTVNLRLVTYNSNNLADVEEIEKIEIFHINPDDVSADNPDGRRLVAEFTGDDVTVEDTGLHLLQVDIEDPCYTIGMYKDVWTINARPSLPKQTVSQCFEIYPDLWYATPIPVVYDFSFHFQPNKFRKGSKQFIIAEIIPNVPTGSDLCRYYENLAIVSDLRISIEMKNCGGCEPAERDLRLIEDNTLMQFREKRHGFFQLDTEDLACGIYDVWFQLDFGGNRFKSDRMQLQIYD